MSLAVIERAIVTPIAMFAKNNDIDLMVSLNEQSLDKKINILAMCDFLEIAIVIQKDSIEYLKKIINNDLIDSLVDNAKKKENKLDNFKPYSTQYLEWLLDLETIEGQVAIQQKFDDSVKNFKSTLKDILKDEMTHGDKSSVEYTDDMNKAEFQMGEEAGSKIAMAIKHNMMDFVRGLAKAVSDNRVANKDCNYIMFFDMKDSSVITGESNPASISKFVSQIISSLVEHLPTEEKAKPAMQLMVSMIPPMCSEIGANRDTVVGYLPDMLNEFFDSYEKSVNSKDKDDDTDTSNQ